MKNPVKNIVLCCLFLLIPAISIFSADNVPVKSITLEEALKATRESSPMMKKVAADNAANSTDEEKISSMKLLPTLTFDLRLGVVPEARGNVLYSPDKQYDLNGWGPFMQAEFKFVQPILTFGKISNGLNATRKMNEAKTIRSTADIEAVESLAFGAYQSVLSARKAVAITQELKDSYKKLLDKIDEEVKKEDSDLDEGYLFEAKSHSYEVEDYYNTYTGQLKQAYLAFKEVTGISVDDSTNFTDSQAPACELTDSDVQKSIDLALNSNSDMQAAKSGLAALDAKIKYEKSNKYPTLYFAGEAGYGTAPNRADQRNPFVYDPFNYKNLAGFLGVSWNFNFANENIESKKADLERTSLLESKKLLESKLSVEVLGNFNDMVNNYKSTLELDNSLEAAQSWVTLDYNNWEMGSGNPERLVKAMLKYFEIRGKVIEKNYKYNLSVINFAKSTGNLNNYLDWIKNGKVKIY